MRDRKNGTKIDEQLLAGASRHKTVQQNVIRIQTLEDGRVPAKEAKNRKIEGQKRRVTRKENKILSNAFEMGGFKAQKGLWNLA